MVEEGIRFIVTTVDGLYITPIVTVNEDQSGIVILDMTCLNEPIKRIIDTDSIISITREMFKQEDVTESLLSDRELVEV